LKEGGVDRIKLMFDVIPPMFSFVSRDIRCHDQSATLPRRCERILLEHLGQPVGAASNVPAKAEGLAKKSRGFFNARE
jgi:hypothetical protein